MIALVITSGFGNGSLTGTVPFVVTRGYSIDEDVIIAGNNPDITGRLSNQSLTPVHTLTPNRMVES